MTRAAAAQRSALRRHESRHGRRRRAGARRCEPRPARRSCGAAPVFLRQVHGGRVVRLLAGHCQPGARSSEADASVTTEPGIACTVLVADCLPVLFAAPGRARRRGGPCRLARPAGGVLEATLAALCEAAACTPGEVGAWLGACIGPDAFEVGADVLAAFGRGSGGRRHASLRFAPTRQVAGRPAGPGAGPAPGRRRAPDRRRRALLHRGRAVTLLLVPARRRHRADGRGGLDRRAQRRRHRQRQRRRRLSRPRHGAGPSAAQASPSGTCRCRAAGRRRATNVIEAPSQLPPSEKPSASAIRTTT